MPDATTAQRALPKLESWGALLEKTDREFENQAVLNPATIVKDGITHLYYRAVREGNHSTIGYATFRGRELLSRLDHPLIKPEFSYESYGVEDPRVTEIDGTYYLLYTAFDGRNALIAYAESDDLVNWRKKGVISPPITYKEAAELLPDRETNKVYQFWMDNYGGNPEFDDLLVYEKDALLFPERINGKLALVHRILPEIQVTYFDELEQLKDPEFWREEMRNLGASTLMRSVYQHENRHIGGGVPPIKTVEGWLFIYHAVENGTKGRIYHAAAALLDLQDPMNVCSRLELPLFSPAEDWELKGDVDNVVFPSGVVEDPDGDTLHIFYGAADSRIGAKSVSKHELLNQLLAAGGWVTPATA